MPSFTRRVAPTTAVPPNGTHPSPSTSSLFLLPTGLPSLDDILGGGLPLGGVLLVLAPDSQSAWGRLVERYFLAQGLVSDQNVLVVGEERTTRDLVKGCMWVERAALTGGGAGEGSESEGEAGEKEGEAGLGADEGKRIAWRYEKMAKYKTTVGGSGNGTTAPLSLMTTIPNEFLHKGESSKQIQYIPLDPDDDNGGVGHEQNQAGPSTSGKFDNVLQRLHERLEKADNKPATRIAVHELGSVDWSDGEVKSWQLHRFLHSLRQLIRTKSASAIVTLPAELLNGLGSNREQLVNSLSWAVDACVELRGFADDPTLPPLFPTTHGLLTLHSYPTAHTLLPSTLKYSTLLGVAASSSSASSSSGGGGGGAGENNLGFKLKRKKFVLETVHLGVEGGVGERRTEMPDSGVADILAGTQTSSISTAQRDLSEGVERIQQRSSEGASTIDERPKGPAGESGKTKDRTKARARVRFGGEEEVVVSIASGEEHPKQHNHEHGHTHDHGHKHQHHPSASQAAPRIALRHDRPDLYEF